MFDNKKLPSKSFSEARIGLRQDSDNRKFFFNRHREEGKEFNLPEAVTKLYMMNVEALSSKFYLKISINNIEDELCTKSESKTSLLLSKNFN